ncbi:hypothetical protein ACP4OV_017542 [Aristida adscensionis]
MSTTEAATGMASDGDCRLRELQAFDDTKAGVKGLVDSGITSIPAIFRHPPDSVTKTMSTSMAIPVIDLSSARPEELVDQLLTGMLAAVKRFNEQPIEAKRPYYMRDISQKIMFYSNVDLFQSSAASWVDTITCLVAPEPPLPEELPQAIRDVMLEYGDAVTELAMLIHGQHGEPSCGEPLLPPMPGAAPYLGTSKHTDVGFITVLLQDAIGGLQVLADRGDDSHQFWVDVPPLPGALTINIGDMLQLVSNARFRSVEHRVLANQSKDTPRISVASFFTAEYMKTPTRLYGPITELTSSDCCNPPLYRSVTAQEFVAHFHKKGFESRHRLDYFKLEQDTPPTPM